MNSSLLWSDKVPERDGTKSSISDVSISPDTNRIIVAVGNRVLLYNAENGDLIESLKAHKDMVFSVHYSHDGTRFASGGADSYVVIWKANGQGLLKYDHPNAVIQKIKFCPTEIKLVSCTETDFGIWKPDQKRVLKEKMTSRVISIAWSTDGNTFALGTITGLISIRNLLAEEITRIERKQPVWCLLFVPNIPSTGKANSSDKTSDNDILISGCWQKALSFYKLQGSNYKLQSEKTLSYYPCSISYLSTSNNKSSFLIVSGSNKKACLYSREGVRLSDLIVKDSWVWSCASSTLTSLTTNSSDKVVIGCDNGDIDTLSLHFTAVHALYNDRYAYRENLTEIIVHHLLQDRKVRIKCKDLIQHLSLYKNKLAVHLTDRVCIYESNADDLSDIHFRVRKERMSMRTISSNYKGCDNMLITSQNLLFITNTIVESYSFDGQRERIWRLDNNITYSKVVGGPIGKEIILLGLDDGSLIKIHLHNPFPIILYKGSLGSKLSIKSADYSLDKSIIAIVFNTACLNVINIKSQEIIYTIKDGINSVCFNTEINDMLCYCNDKNMFVISGLGIDKQINDPIELHLSGYCIGFQGQRIYCLYHGNIASIDVPQGQFIQRALDNNDYNKAYSLACLGATEDEWKLLAMKALRNNMINISKNAFGRLKDIKYLYLLEQIERYNTNHMVSIDSNRKRQQLVNTSVDSLDPIWTAELLAYEGFHNDAAKAYARLNQTDESIRILIDMKRYEDAKLFARNFNKVDLINDLTAQQAHWLEEINDWKAASQLFLSLGNLTQAMKVIISNANNNKNDTLNSNNIYNDAIIELVREISIDIGKEALELAVEYFLTNNLDNYSREVLIKLGDINRLMSLYIKQSMWEEAAKLAEDNDGKFNSDVFLPYAEYLLSQDKFDDAMIAYKKANRQDLSIEVLDELSKNAVIENRFKDAAYYYWLLSKEIGQYLSNSNSVKSNHITILQQSQYELKADLYYAYSTIYSYITDPFTNQQPEVLFQVARFIINSLGSCEVIPLGISTASTIYTLAKQSMSLGCYKLARHSYERLNKLKLPNKNHFIFNDIELDMLIVQAKPVRDATEHLPVCYRCGSTNPLLNPFTSKYAKGDVCTNCGHPFVRSFINFDVLPLVEFVPEPKISDEETIELIRQQSNDLSKKFNSWKESKDGDADVIRFDGNDDYDYDRNNSNDGTELFTKCLNKTIAQQKSSYLPVTVDANTLLSMKRSEVFVCRPSSQDKRATFYKNMLPEIPIAISQPCHRFFHLEDFEFAYLSNKGCPYSRLKNVGEYGSL